MWFVIRAELNYLRPWLLGALGIATGVITLLSLILLTVGDDGANDQALAGLCGMMIFIAPLVVSFIVQGYRSEERRTRLLMASSLAPRQIALVAVFLHLFLFGLGCVAAGLVIALGSLIVGQFAPESVHMAGSVGGMMFAIGQLVTLGQESNAARHQQRTAAARGGWTVFAGAILIYATAQFLSIVSDGPQTWAYMHLSNVVIALSAMATATWLFERRTDFTR